MNYKFPLLLILVFNFTVTNAQELFENSRFGFSMKRPAYWIETNNKELNSLLTVK